MLNTRSGACVGIESSTASIVTAYVPALVGAPDKTPPLLTERPGGSPLPTQIDGGKAPAAASVREYAAPTFPDASELVVMAAGRAIPMAWLDAAGHSESLPGNLAH